MGTGASVTRSPAALTAELERLRQRELNTKEEVIKEWDVTEAKKDARIMRLQGERDELAQQVKELKLALNNQDYLLKKEKNKTLSLTYSKLPLSLINFEDPRKIKLPVAKTYPLITIAQCDVVGFSYLSAALKPHEIITVLDHLHALVEEAFHDIDILITERSSEKCVAVSGLDEHLAAGSSLPNHYDSRSLSSMTDSSYGSDVDILEGSSKKHQMSTTKNASYYANIMALAVLNLMSASSKVHVPLRGRKHLQLRIALHSGPCSAGVLGLQTSLESNRIPEFRFLGPTLHYVNMLCQTGLALQIRVSKECKALLDQCEGFLFERCPDYLTASNGKPVVTYWLIGQNYLSMKLPSLDLAIPLTEYNDI